LKSRRIARLSQNVPDPTKARVSGLFRKSCIAGTSIFRTFSNGQVAGE
jgi:hypothetical protein